MQTTNQQKPTWPISFRTGDKEMLDKSQRLRDTTNVTHEEIYRRGLEAIASVAVEK